VAKHYPHLLDPAMYPNCERRQLKVPTWATLENRTQFAALRDLCQTSWREDLDRYTREFRLGNVVWPMVQMLFSPHVGQAIEEIRKSGLYLFDLLGTGSWASTMASRMAFMG